MNSSPQSIGGKATAIILRKKAIESYYQDPQYCLNCKQVIEVKVNQRVSEVKKKKFCNASCANTFNNKGIKRTNANAKSLCNCGNKKKIKAIKCINCYTQERANLKQDLLQMTKKVLFEYRKNWQSARTFIRKNALEVYQRHKKPFSCYVCNYALHVEIAHIKAVASFSLNSSIKEINDPDNLVALCPNHHWEFDQGSLKI